LLNVHDDPLESLENTKDVSEAGLAVENVEPHGFKHDTVPFVILYGEFFVLSIE
jgi:hypothetical protein